MTSSGNRPSNLSGTQFQKFVEIKELIEHTNIFTLSERKIPQKMIEIINKMILSQPDLGIVYPSKDYEMPEMVILYTVSVFVLTKKLTDSPACVTPNWKNVVQNAQHNWGDLIMNYGQYCSLSGSESHFEQENDLFYSVGHPVVEDIGETHMLDHPNLYPNIQSPDMLSVSFPNSGPGINNASLQSELNAIHGKVETAPCPEQQPSGSGSTVYQVVNPASIPKPIKLTTNKSLLLSSDLPNELLENQTVPLLLALEDKILVQHLAVHLTQIIPSGLLNRLKGSTLQLLQGISKEFIIADLHESSPHYHSLNQHVSFKLGYLLGVEDQVTEGFGAEPIETFKQIILKLTREMNKRNVLSEKEREENVSRIPAELHQRIKDMEDKLEIVAVSMESVVRLQKPLTHPPQNIDIESENNVDTDSSSSAHHDESDSSDQSGAGGSMSSVQSSLTRQSSSGSNQSNFSKHSKSKRINKRRTKVPSSYKAVPRSLPRSNKTCYPADSDPLAYLLD